METTTLREVDWMDHDYVWEDGQRGTYRSCDICYESFQKDVSGDNPKPIRRFYYDDAEQLTVCEHCVEKYLAENKGD